MRVRPATVDDTQAMARVMAVVAEEGTIATEPPVDVEVRARRFADKIEGDGPGASWVLEDDGRVVGHAGTDHRIEGVVSFGMAILPEARGRGGGRMLLDAIVEHARASG